MQYNVHATYHICHFLAVSLLYNKKRENGSMCGEDERWELWRTYQNFSTDETKYVDPRNYHSPYDALSALRVDEIPPREIKLSQPLGEGM